MTDPTAKDPASAAAPVALIVAGPAGSGKSTLGREVARLLGAAMLDQDVLTQPLTALIAEMTDAGDDLDHPTLTGGVRRARYDTVLDTAADNLRIGLSVVLVAPFTRELAVPAARAGLAARLTPGRVVLVRVQVPAGVAAARRIVRDLPRDRAALSRAAIPAAAVGDDPTEFPTDPSSESPSESLSESPTGDRPVPELIADGQADPSTEAARIVALIPALLPALRRPAAARFIRDPIETGDDPDRS